MAVALSGVPTMTSMVVPGMPPGSMSSMWVPPTGMPKATSMFAAPAQVPTMTSMYQAPTSMYRSPSYVPVPVPAAKAAAASPQAAVGSFAAAQPVALTAGMKEPASIEQDKARYHKALEAQLKKESDAAAKEGEIQKAMLEQKAMEQIALFTLQIEEQLKLQCLQVDQMTNAHAAALMEAAVTQRTLMDEKSAIATMEYQKKKAMEEMSQKSYALQKQYHEAEVKMLAELQTVRVAEAKAGVPMGWQV